MAEVRCTQYQYYPCSTCCAHFTGHNNQEESIIFTSYALVGGAPKAYGSRRVCFSVCVCARVILQHIFLRDHNNLSNESCNPTTTQHSNTAKLAKFLILALLSDYSMMCFDGCCQQSRVQ